MASRVTTRIRGALCPEIIIKYHKCKDTILLFPSTLFPPEYEMHELVSGETRGTSVELSGLSFLVQAEDENARDKKLS